MIRTLCVLLLAACSSKPDPAVLAIRHYGCGTCHQIPSVDGAVGHVGVLVRQRC